MNERLRHGNDLFVSSWIEFIDVQVVVSHKRGNRDNFPKGAKIQNIFLFQTCHFKM
jgi:hypothetical protein